jgi:hypothetical protein
MSDGGKGSNPRPYSVPLEVAHANHEAIFGKKEPKPRWVPPPLPDFDVKTTSKVLDSEDLSQ